MILKVLVHKRYGAMFTFDSTAVFRCEIIVLSVRHFITSAKTGARLLLLSVYLLDFFTEKAFGIFQAHAEHYISRDAL